MTCDLPLVADKHVHQGQRGRAQMLLSSTLRSDVMFATGASSKTPSLRGH